MRQKDGYASMTRKMAGQGQRADINRHCKSCIYFKGLPIINEWAGEMYWCHRMMTRHPTWKLRPWELERWKEEERAATGLTKLEWCCYMYDGRVS